MFGSLVVCLRANCATSILRNLKFWNYRRVHGVPSKEEMLMLYPMHVTPDVSPRIAQTVLFYSYGMTLEDVAQKTHVTRERVRQILWKAWRLARVDSSV